MKIVVENIPSDGLDVVADASELWVRGAAKEALDAPPEAAELSFHVERLGQIVRVRGRASASAPRDCDRCGGPVRIELAGRVDLYYRTPDPASAAERAGLEREDLDIGWFDGEHLDLAFVLTEQLALWLPGRIRCGDNGVVQVEGPFECLLSEGVLLDEPAKRSSPFAKLRLPD